MTNIITDIKKKILFNYTIDETYESGIILKTWEIKSIKKNGFNITCSYINISNNACFLINSHIKPIRYEFKIHEFDEKRTRELLLKKKEINYLYGRSKIKNLTIIPSKIYWKHNFIKLEIHLCSGKRKYDKRQELKIKEDNKSNLPE
ncbi:MAG TPA: SsrA-binding protein SmpB [Candidatus Azoamicus sp. OHIO2]